MVFTQKVLPKFLLASLIFGALTACDEPDKVAANSAAELCPIAFEPVCASVAPTFCQLGDCGVVGKTFDNACFARKSGATKIVAGACGYSVQGVSSPERLGMNLQPIRRATAAVNPYDPSRLQALYRQIASGLNVANVQVQRSGIGATVVIRGTIAQNCGPVQVNQMARLGDSFGVSVLKSGPEGCGGEHQPFSAEFVLDPGQNPWVRGIEYEVVVNGKPGRFVF